MPTNIEKLLGMFQGNAYPAMLEVLALDLGVTADSLRRLALGWVPIVPFKRKTSFCGWWVIPERDADGVPTGLSLRNMDGDKTAYPGSKHGIIYEVNPEHERGGATSEPGEWIRTMEAGVLCPVCQKPDGCLVNADNPADPRGDAVCIRNTTPVRVGDWVRPMRFGHLHSNRRAASGVSALAQTCDELLVVEGMSDTAAAMDLGFDGAGRPSNLACMDTLCDLVRGRKGRIIIVGENDARVNKLSGKTEMPGRDGMIAAFQMIKRVHGDVCMLMPPAHVKDFRAWKAKFGLTRDQFLEYVDKHGEKYAEELVLSDNRPLTIARSFLNTNFKMASRFTIRRWQGSWWKYTGAKYDEVDPEAFRQPIYPWSHDKQVLTINSKSGAETLQPLMCNTSMVANVEDAIMSETLIQADVPCWINGKRGPDPKDLIVFNNGILHVPSFLSGAPEKEYLLDSTPDLFTTVALPFAFDPTATCYSWRGFLRTSLGDDSDKIRLLREWLGYCLTPDTSMHKLMYLRGPTCAGKSVILNVLCRMIGEDQAASTSFRDICGDFGLQPLIGKQLCVIPDIRVSAKTDVMRGLELLLNITSGDPVQINRKFKEAMSRYKLMTRVVIAGNDFIEVPDHAGAMVRRLNVIEFANSFVGREDWHLEDKLAAEIPGIAVWALTGLKRLREQGQFTVPESSRLAMQEWRRSNSPLASFIDEVTHADPNSEVLKDELYDCWSKWAEERRVAPISKSRFLERMRSNAPHAIADCYDKGGHKFNVFRGLSLDRLAARKFLGRP